MLHKWMRWNSVWSVVVSPSLQFQLKVSRRSSFHSFSYQASVSILLSFLEEPSSPCLASSLTPGDVEVFLSSLLSITAVLCAFSAYYCSQTLLISRLSNIIFFLALCKNYCINSLTPSQDWIFLLSSVSYVKCAILFKVTSLCQFIYRTFIFHLVPACFFPGSWKLVWIVL